MTRNHRFTRRARHRAADVNLRGWLAAERRDHDADAQRALHELFQLLPAAEPAPDFADRILARAGIAARPAAAGATTSTAAPWRWPARALLAVCLTLAALGFAYVPLLTLVLGRVIGPTELVATAAGALAAAAEHLPAALALARAVAAITTALANAFSSPPVLVVGLLALATATLAWRWLGQLLSPQRSLAHDPTS